MKYKDGRETRQEFKDAWIKFQRETNDALEEKGAEYRMIYLPPKDMMPYCHAKSVTEMENQLDNELSRRNAESILERLKNRKEGKDDEPITMTLDEEDAKVLEIALMVYKNALLAVHGKRMRSDPMPIIWETDYDDDERGVGYPKCPNCHELAYGLEEIADGKTGFCPFCGQRYYIADEDREKAEPNPEETQICPMCGKETLVGRRAKCNGHFHGTCTNCGCTVME